MVYWILWFAAGALLVFAFAAGVLPKLFLRAFAASLPVRDRALGKYMLSEGVGILYQPSVRARAWMPYYQLIARGDARPKRFVGMWAQPVSDARYTVVAFDGKGAPLSVHAVREDASGSFTRTLLLPEETDRVTVYFTRVGGRRVEREYAFGVPFFLRLALFSCAAALAASAMLCCMLGLLCYFLRDAYGDLWQIARFSAAAGLFGGVLAVLPPAAAGIVALWRHFCLSARLRSLLSRARARLLVPRAWLEERAVPPLRRAAAAAAFAAANVFSALRARLPGKNRARRLRIPAGEEVHRG